MGIGRKKAREKGKMILKEDKVKTKLCNSGREEGLKRRGNGKKESKYIMSKHKFPRNNIIIMYIQNIPITLI